MWGVGLKQLANNTFVRTIASLDGQTGTLHVRGKHKKNKFEQSHKLLEILQLPLTNIGEIRDYLLMDALESALDYNDRVLYAVMQKRGNNLNNPLDLVGIDLDTLEIRTRYEKQIFLEYFENGNSGFKKS